VHSRADAGPVVKGLQRCRVYARVLIAEGDMSIDIVADRWTRPIPLAACPEEIHATRKQIGLAVPASEQEEQRFFRGDPAPGKLFAPEDDRVGGSVSFTRRRRKTRMRPLGANDAGHQLPKLSR